MRLAASGGGALRPGSACLDCLLDALDGLRLKPQTPLPSCWGLPTHFPRDPLRAGRQIDGIWTGWANVSPVDFDADMRHVVGTDHALLVATLSLRCSARSRWQNAGGQRRVWDHAEVMARPVFSVADVEQLAADTTSHPRRAAYEDTDSVLAAVTAARGRPRDPQAWKLVHRLRRRAKRRWRRKRIAAVLGGDWGEYRALRQQASRRHGWWGKLLEDKSGGELAAEIQEHFEKKVRDEDTQWDADLSDLIGNVCAPTNDWLPFTEGDLANELEHMKVRAAVGPDGVGVDLLRKLHGRGDGALLRIVNETVKGEELAPGWEKSLLALIPKCDEPLGPADLRPIAVSSALMKLTTRVVMARCFHALRRPSGVSACGKGRQPADLVGCITRLRDMGKEWKIPFLVAKLDVKGAFDRINRSSVARRLTVGLGEHYPVELTYLLRQLGSNVLEGVAPGGGRVRVVANRGIKQGAPESAELFGLIMTMAVECAAASPEWGDIPGELSDVPVDVVVFQDDVVLWDATAEGLERRIALIVDAIGAHGLALAPTKTAIAASPYYEGRSHVLVEGFAVDVGSAVSVLGIRFDFQGATGDQAAEILERARKAAWLHDELLRGDGSWQDKAVLMRSLVDGCFTWTAGALHWPRDKLMLANSLQVRILRRAFRMGRLRGEDWVLWNERTLRAVRGWLHAQRIERWSAKILRLQHQLMGHWMRQWEGNDWGIAAKMQQWRSLAWWRQEQMLLSGRRHPGRFYPDNAERNMADTLGETWWALTQDRPAWAASLPKWLARWDVRWTRGRQASLRW